MTDTFTASNGYRIDGWGKATGIRVHNAADTRDHNLGKYAVDALREYFQAERDNELGRWRWPEHPDWVVLPTGSRHQGAYALNESTGDCGELTRWEADLLAPPTEPLSQAIAAYFDANPELDRPWERAEEGDVWALTFHDKESSWFVNGRYFQNTRTFTNILPTDKFITAGRRIYPTEES